MTTKQRAVLDENQRRELAVAAYYLCRVITKIDEMLADLVLGKALSSAAAEPLCEYRQVVEPRRHEVVTILYELLNITEDTEPDDGN